MELLLLQFENPRYVSALDDNFAAGHPMFLNPNFQCSNLECSTCIGLQMARQWTEKCYQATHKTCDIEHSIGKLIFSSTLLNLYSRPMHRGVSTVQLVTTKQFVANNILSPS